MWGQVRWVLEAKSRRLRREVIRKPPPPLIGSAWRGKFIVRYQITSPLQRLAGLDLPENRLLVESREGLELFPEVIIMTEIPTGMETPRSSIILCTMRAVGRNKNAQQS